MLFSSGDRHYEQTGLFDESLFLLHEETDWCIRAKKMNFSLLIISNAIVSHKISTTIGMFSKIYLYYIGRNWLLVGKKNFSFFRYLNILVTEFLIRFPYYLYHVTKKGQIRMIKYYLRGLFDGIRGISGEAKYNERFHKHYENNIIKELDYAKGHQWCQT